MPIRPLADIEREHILRAVKQCKGDLDQAAAALQVSSRTLYRKLESYDSRPEKRAVIAKRILAFALQAAAANGGVLPQPPKKRPTDLFSLKSFVRHHRDLLVQHFDPVPKPLSGYPQNVSWILKPKRSRRRIMA